MIRRLRFAPMRAVAMAALAALAAMLLCTLTLPAAAQGDSRTGMRGPGTGRHSIGLNLGTARYQVGCGLLPGCDTTDRSVYLYGRSMRSDYWGAELGLLDLGSIERGGASTSARGVNLSLIGRAPLGASFSGYGKLGVSYGRTSTSATAGSGIAASRERGFGVSYGLGLSWDFSPRMSAVVEWDSYDLRFAGGNREPVRATSLGLQFRY